MLDILGALVLDKVKLIGGCTRLAATVDANRLQSEVGQLPPACWGTTGGRIGVHSAAEAVFLRGFAPAEGDKPVEDRPALDRLPYTRFIIENLIDAPRLRCVLARLAPGMSIAPHVDRAPYFSKTLRIHMPVESNSEVYMVASGRTYCMRPGEVWALNNSAPHGVWNASASMSRTHLICDFLPSPALLDLLSRGERDLGRQMPQVDRHLMSASRLRATAGG